MMRSLLNRLWNASPSSTSAAFLRALRGAPSGPPAPRWERIAAGPLAGRELLLARAGNGAWLDMIEGRYDAGLYAALDRLEASGDSMWDVGAHFGYHTLGFAARYPGVSVLAFEPNPANLERLRANLARNSDLAARIDVLPIGAADRAGMAPLTYSPDVDDGSSSWSHIEGSGTSDRSRYATFIRTSVPVQPLDEIAAARRPPSVVKIDVEGAEVLVLRGAQGILAGRTAAWLVEVHTAALMFGVRGLFDAAGYRVELLEVHSKHRCLILARPALSGSSDAG